MERKSSSGRRSQCVGALSGPCQESPRWWVLIGEWKPVSRIVLEIGDSDLGHGCVHAYCLLCVRCLVADLVSAQGTRAGELLGQPSPDATTLNQARLSGSGFVCSNEVWIVNSSSSVFA